MARRSEITVLVADHSTIGRQVLEQMLDHLGIDRVLTARAGREACAILAKCPVDLLIAEMDLPDLDGLSLLAGLRGGDPDDASGDGTATGIRSVNPALRVVLSATNPAPAILGNARRLDLAAVLLKPYRIENVLHCVELGCGRI